MHKLRGITKRQPCFPIKCLPGKVIHESLRTRTEDLDWQILNKESYALSDYFIFVRSMTIEYKFDSTYIVFFLQYKKKFLKRAQTILSSITSVLTLLLLFLYMYWVQQKLYFGQWLYVSKSYQVHMQFDFSNRTSTG